jgi:GDPmannose 4,6-dehydratase
MAAADFALAEREAQGLSGARHGRHLVESLPG